MRTIHTTAIVGEDGTITLPVPHDIPAGKHQVVVIIDEQLAETNGDGRRNAFDLTPYPVGLIADDFTFRREDLYNDG